MTRLNVFLALIALGLVSSQVAVAGPSRDSDEESEKVDVGSIKQKYWARGDESELGVVQNRLYTESGKIELGVFGGIVNMDPFLNVASFGVSAGYHFNEYWGFRALAWKDFTSPSSALTAFQSTAHYTADTDNPYAFYGGEAMWSLLYGKLSVIGKAIIYYDFHLLGGLGVTQTESGSNLTGIIGLGQQIYLNHWMALQVDWRLMPYSEGLVNKGATPGTPLGQVVATQMNWSNSFTFGFTFLLGGGER